VATAAAVTGDFVVHVQGVKAVSAVVPTGFYGLWIAFTAVLTAERFVYADRILSFSVLALNH